MFYHPVGKLNRSISNQKLPNSSDQDGFRQTRGSELNRAREEATENASVNSSKDPVYKGGWGGSEEFLQNPAHYSRFYDYKIKYLSEKAPISANYTTTDPADGSKYKKDWGGYPDNVLEDPKYCDGPYKDRIAQLTKEAPISSNYTASKPKSS